ncbi:MAG TPA: RNA polymerase sigma factor, partial [Jiangellaceae bacterium]|nr:RNA polymerase sigma factor [Jiangellaceae bacterium]
MSANPDRVPTDAELLAAVAEGDPEAFGVLYDQHAPWLLVRLRQRTASSDLADQVAQETFLVVWRDAGRFRGRGEVGAWIWGIAIR